jgi:hypothetical protein
MKNWSSEMKIRWMRSEDGVVSESGPRSAASEPPSRVWLGSSQRSPQGSQRSLKCVLSQIQIQIVLVCAIMLYAIYRSNIGRE